MTHLFDTSLIYWPVYVMCAIAYLIGVATGVFCAKTYRRKR